jgi:hypothetical protein
MGRPPHIPTKVCKKCVHNVADITKPCGKDQPGLFRLGLSVPLYCVNYKFDARRSDQSELKRVVSYNVKW